MKKQLITVMAAVSFLLAGSMLSATTGQAAGSEEDCRVMAMESNVPEEKLQQFITDCLADQTGPEAKQEAPETDEDFLELTEDEQEPSETPAEE